MKGTGKQRHPSMSYSVKKNEWRQKKNKSFFRKKAVISNKMSVVPASHDDVKRDNLFNTHYELTDDARLSPSKPNNVSQLAPPPHAHSIESLTPENQFKKNLNLTEEQHRKVKEIYSKRKKLSTEKPNLFLREAGQEASLSVDEASRYPLFFPDIEDFLSLLQGNLSITRWIHLKRMSKVTNVILLCVEGIGLDSYLREGQACSSLSSYKVAIEFVSPLSYGDQVEHCLASKLDPQPLCTTQSSAKDGFVVGLDSFFNITSDKKRPVQDIEKSSEHPKKVFNEKIKNVEDSPKCPTEVTETTTDKTTEADVNTEALNRLSKELDIPACTLKRLIENPELYLESESKQVLPMSLQSEDKFSRLDVIMTPREMANAKYPLPFGGARYSQFAKSKVEYSQVREDSPMLGLDCEMCMTKAGSELTRISIVNERHEVVYERLVKPYNKIINYLTRYSGITPKMMKDVTTRLPDVQCELRNMLPSDAILVGQSLNCDLIAMKVMHPYVIDTSLIFNMSGNKAHKSKLKTLCAEFLSESIQDPQRKGHDSIEDSLAALKLVQAKLRQSIEWGNACLGYKRTEEESKQAKVTLQEKAAAESQTKANSNKARLAFNSIVDTPSNFLRSSHTKESLQEKLLRFEKLKKDIEEENKKCRKRKLSKMCESPTLDDSSKCDSGRVKKRKMEQVVDVSISNGDELTPSDHLTLIMNSERLTSSQQQNTTLIKSRTVTIIGKEEVVDKYRKCLPIHLFRRVQLLPSKSNSEVLSNIELRDSQAENSIIIAHVTANQLSKVNQWSKSLLSVCQPNDVICISLNGSQDSSDSRGAFLATVPFLNRLSSVKQLVHKYLLSEGVSCRQ